MSHRAFFRTLRLTPWLLVALGATLPRVASAIAYTFSTPIAGDSVPVTLSLTDAPGGAGVDVSISIPAGQGDLLGLFGNVSNEALIPGMAASDPSHIVTQSAFSANGVTKVGGGNTMEPVGNWDWGLRFGQNGSAGGPVLGASFRITGSGITVAQLTGALNQGWRFGVRIQSTQGPNFSAKIGLNSSQPPNGQGPTVSITSPVNGLLTRNTPVTVTGNFTGTAPVTVTVNGVTAAVSGSSYSASVPLVEGSNTLTATATNAGGSASASVTVVLDTTPPVVTFTSPPDGAVTAATSELVTGTVTDASPIASFTLNGQTVALNSGAFSTTVPLSVGANPFTAQATDAAGNTGSATLTVNRALVPTVNISSPADGLLTGTTPISVTGTITGTAPVAVTVNGVTATVTGSSYSASVVLLEGANTLTATATNAVGTANASVSVTLDTTPPAVTITSPADGSTTGNASTVVTGTVTDASPITSFTVNGAPVTLSSGSFTTTVSLAVGANPITASATDAAGNTGSAAIAINRAAPPTLTLTAPPNGVLVPHTPIAVTGTISGTPPISVNVNGTAASVSGTSFTAQVSLVEGPNTLTAVATNLAGSATASVSVTLDTIPPVVTITAPPNGAVVSNAAQTVTGTVTDASPIAALVVAGQNTAPGNSFSTGIQLAPGPNPIAVQATDAAGNTGFASISVTLANAGPPLGIHIQSPPNHAIVSTPFIPVSGTITDPNASVDVSGTAAEASAAGFVAPVVVLNVGDNQITATGHRGSETATDSITVRYEKPPIIYILHPRSGTRLRQTQTDVSGFVDNPAAAVDVNGVTATVDEAGGFVARGVPLQPGDNLLTAQAVDLDGNVGTDTAHVNRDDGQTQLLHLVIYDPSRLGVIDGFAAFRAALAARGLAPEQFTPPLDRPVIGRHSPAYLFVFAEQPGPVTIPEVVQFGAEPTQQLRPMSELSTLDDFDPSVTPLLLPLTFEPLYFQVFQLQFPSEQPE